MEFTSIKSIINIDDNHNHRRKNATKIEEINRIVNEVNCSIAATQRELAIITIKISEKWKQKKCKRKEEEFKKVLQVEGNTKQKKMWHTTHELSATQVHHPTINAYQHYSTAQIPHHHVAHHNGNMNKWNIAGQRSSYSLPHPGHAQSNMRWSKYGDDKAHLKAATQTQPARNLSNSTRNLSTMPPNISTSPVAAQYILDPQQQHPQQRQLFGPPGVGMPRQRPASMYDSPSSMPNINYHNHHLNGFIPLPSNSSKKDAKQQQQHQQHASGKNANVGLRQSPGELVRRFFSYGIISHFFLVVYFGLLAPLCCCCTLVCFFLVLTTLIHSL